MPAWLPNQTSDKQLISDLSEIAGNRKERLKFAYAAFVSQQALEDFIGQCLR